jgi:hypothetical protein
MAFLACSSALPSTQEIFLFNTLPFLSTGITPCACVEKASPVIASFETL